MNPGELTPRQRELLWSTVRHLGDGDFRGVLDPADGLATELGAEGFGEDLLLMVVRTANGLSATARGDFVGARYTYGKAAQRLPHAFRRRDRVDGIPQAAPPARSASAVDDGPVAEAVAEIARVIWSGQREIHHLRRWAAGIEPVEALVEAAGQEAAATIFDTYYLRAVEQPRHTRLPLPAPHQRSTLCDRATRIVQLGDPRAVDVKSKPWRTAGGYDGLFARALAELAAADSAVPWPNAPGASCVRVRLGRRRLWEHARRAHEDRKGLT